LVGIAKIPPKAQVRRAAKEELAIYVPQGLAAQIKSPAAAGQF
jgi:hypothetical protein